jgi:hypothetical protein
MIRKANVFVKQCERKQECPEGPTAPCCEPLWKGVRTTAQCPLLSGIWAGSKACEMTQESRRWFAEGQLPGSSYCAGGTTPWCGVCGVCQLRWGHFTRQLGVVMVRSHVAVSFAHSLFSPMPTMSLVLLVLPLRGSCRWAMIIEALFAHFSPFVRAVCQVWPTSVLVHLFLL